MEIRTILSVNIPTTKSLESNIITSLYLSVVLTVFNGQEQPELSDAPWGKPQGFCLVYQAFFFLLQRQFQRTISTSVNSAAPQRIYS